MHQVLKTISCALLILLCSAASPSACRGGGIAAITRRDIIPYSMFLQSYMQAASSAGQDHAVKIFEADPHNSGQNSAMAEEIAAFKPEILLCIGLRAVAYRQKYFPRAPMIYAMVFGPARFAAQANEPALGLSMTIDPGEKIAVLRRINKSVRSIGAVYDPAQAGSEVTAATLAAKQQGISFDAVAVADAKQALEAVEAVFSRTDAFMLFFDKTVLTPQTLETIFTCSFRGRKPVIGLSEKYVHLGALFAIECDEKALGRQAWRATESCLADRAACSGITAPPDAGRLVVNTKIAVKMGLIIPDAIRQTSRMVK